MPQQRRRDADAVVRHRHLHRRFVRVDFEAALDAALTRDRFDAAILDPATPGITRELLETSLPAGCQIIELTDEIVEALRRAFVERWN
jgi:hypothetical protein